MEADIRVPGNAADLAEAAATLFVDTTERVLALQARLAVALFGENHARRHLFPAGHARFRAPRRLGARPHLLGRRALRAARPCRQRLQAGAEKFLDHVPLPASNIHRMRGELEPAQAAADYEQDLRAFFGEALPRFDLMLQGLGEDGHTASLFPGTAALHESRRWVAANWVEKLQSWRLTLTPVVINQAALVVFLVAGARKSAIVRDVLSGAYRPEVLPAQLVRPGSGQLIWLMDDAAAGRR